MRDITWYVWKPLDWQENVGYHVNPDKCRHKVHESGRSVLLRQCQRRAVDEVEGYGFCKMHAARVREALGLE